MTDTAVNTLIAIIRTGDLSAARAWAVSNREGLNSMRKHGPALAAVAHACNVWGAPLVWPFVEALRPAQAHRRVLDAIRTGGSWRCGEDTLAVIVAAGWATHANGRWEVVPRYGVAVDPDVLDARLRHNRSVIAGGFRAALDAGCHPKPRDGGIFKFRWVR